jgi:hypothetical protein
MALNGAIHQNGQRIKLLSVLTIAAAVAATATTPVLLLSGIKYLVVQANFLYGAGGTSVDAYVQTSVDGGTTWIDIMEFAFTTAAARKISAVVISTAVAASVTPSDGALTASTILSGVLGDRLRVKYVTVGTYSGATSLAVDAIAKG